MQMFFHHAKTYSPKHELHACSMTRETASPKIKKDDTATHGALQPTHRQRNNTHKIVDDLQLNHKNEVPFMHRPRNNANKQNQIQYEMKSTKTTTKTKQRNASWKQIKLHITNSTKVRPK